MDRVEEIVREGMKECAREIVKTINESWDKDKREIEQLKKGLESALADSCKYIDCSYREAQKEGK